MKIAELKPGMRRVDVAGKIVDMETPRDVQTKFGPGQVASATLQDESGTVKVTLWNENITKVAVNDTVQIENGYVDSFRGELQLNVGRYGKLAKVESAETQITRPSNSRIDQFLIPSHSILTLGDDESVAPSVYLVSTV